MHVLDTLKERGFLAQVTFEDDLRRLLENERVTFYNGFDPTAESLTVGHFIPVMMMAHMQKAGHRPIALVGGGTTVIGDPSDRTDMRPMLTREEINNNAQGLKSQLSRFLDFSEGNAIMVDNADWLLELNLMEFIREIGVHFSVNRMLTADCYKTRMEKGLTFFELTYMLLQSYDFLELFRRYDCKLQTGGDDQWSNILAGADLIRRKEQKEAFVLTNKLLLTADGKKMGKSAAGAVWISPERTSDFDFYQYFRNIEDSGVENCLKMLTFLPMEEIRRLAALPGEKINDAKIVLAREVTTLVRGADAAKRAEEMAISLFSGDGDDAPTVEISRDEALSDPRVARLVMLCGLTKSIGEARRAIEQGGVTANGETITSVDAVVSETDFSEGLLLRRGKKAYKRIVLV